MQKQEVTILSAQFSGFLQLVEGLTSEEISKLMNEIHSITENTVKLHKGKINQYTGEKLLAVFENSKSNPSILSHAVGAAFELKDHLNSYSDNKKLKGEFGLKIGLVKGEVVAAEFGSVNSKQSTIMGEAVNQANRICEFAGVDQILVDEKIYLSAQDRFGFQSLEPIPIKGTENVLPIFELAGKKRKKLDIKPKSKRKIASAMVGRTREAELVEGLIKNLVAGKGSILNIVGKAGIGKSRLMAEMKVQPIMDKVLLLEGRARSTGKNLSFHPITNLIKSWAGITEDDIPSVSSEKLYQGIKHNTPEQADEIYAFIATMMGLPLEGKYKERIKGIEGEALEKLILKNLRDLIIAATKDKPRIYLIEDMHWADSSSLTLFESLYKLSQNHPVMFINVMRPGYKETGDYILKYLVDNFPGDHTTININPLEEKESGNLIKNLLRETSLPDEIHNLIICKTQGNPFFIEEIIRSFIDEGIVEVEEGSFVVTEKINDVNIPETINEAILSRVDKLDEKTRELLNTASVMGRNFYYKVLEEATDTIEELDERLAYLSEVQLISESKKKEEIEYLFKHALAQQLTYDAMMQQSRKDTHLKIARSIEKVFSANINEFYGTLAYHYDKAENKEKAEEYLVKAGDEAVKSGAPFEALRFYEDALRRKQTGEMHIDKEEEIKDLEIKIAFAYEDSGNNIKARVHFEAIMDKYFGYSHPRNKLAIPLYGISNMLFFIFMINNPLLFFRKKVDNNFHLFMKVVKEWGEATATADPRTFAMLSFRLLTHMSRYRLHDSIRGLTVFTECNTLFMWTGISFSVSQKMLDYGKQGHADEHPISQITYRQSKIMHEFMVGKWEVDKDFEQVFKQCIARGQFWPLTIYTMYTGRMHIELGNFDGFLDCMYKMDEIYNSFENQHAKAQMYRTLAPGYYRFRKMSKALSAADEGIKYTIETGHNAMLMVLYASKSQIHTLRGEFEEAKRAFSEADKLIDHHKIITIYYCPYLLAKIKLELAEFKLLDKREKTFHKLYRKTLKSASKLVLKSKKMAGSLTEAYLLRAEVYRVKGKNKLARREILSALFTGQKFCGRLDLSRAYFETGKFLSDPTNKYNELNGHPADYYFEKAKAMFEEMDLQWDLEEYQKFIEK